MLQAPRESSGWEERLDQVLTAYLHAVEAGQAPDHQEWLARYPDLAAELNAFFGDQEAIDRFAGPLRPAGRAARLTAEATAGLADTVPDGLGAAGGFETPFFGDYELLEMIAEGGMAVVYKARHRQMQHLVALKVLLSGRFARPSDLQRFRNEAETIAGLDHPNIVPIHEVGERDGRLFLALQFMEGGNLGRQLARFGDDPRGAAALVAAVARAVHHAHERGVLHRDLKPSNILLDANGQPHVADFGLARRIEGDSGLTQSGAVLGTPSYMAPEQTAGDRRALTTAADVYGLGGILYALLTGGPPFAGTDVLDTLTQVREREAEPPGCRNPRAPGDLATIALQCLQKDPRRRYVSALALAEDLERFLAGQPIAARPVRWWERLWKWARRRPAAAALVVLGGLVVAATIAGVLVANAKLHEAAEEARRGRVLADGRYRAARDTLSRMLNQVKDPKVAEVPRLQELRQKLLEEALAFYQKALDESDTADPVIQRDAAFAYTETGAIQSALGQPGKADEQFRRAVALIGSLPAEDRATPECRIKLAVCHSYLGAHANAARRHQDAERHYRTERTLCEELIRDEPGKADWQDELARAEHHLGRIHLETKRLPEALAHYLRAVEIRTPLVKAHPEVENYQVHLAESCINLGVVYADLGRKSEEQAAGEKAIKLLEPLVKHHPENLDWSLSLSGAYGNVGNQLKDTGKRREALRLLNRAVALTDAALLREPRHGVVQQSAFTAHAIRAQIYESLKNWPAAAKEWERVIALNRWRAPWLLRLYRALDLARSGDHVRAAAEAESLLKEPRLPEEGVFALARLYALAIDPARKDASNSPVKAESLAEDYPRRALDLLKNLQGKGYFRDGDNARELAQEPELDALRGRDDFRELLKQVQAGGK